VGFEAGIEVKFLGPLEVTVDGHPREVAGRHERRLLALLASEAGRPLGVSRMVDFLWGESPPRTAQKSLQTHVSRLRAMLDIGLDVLARRGETYVLDLPMDAIDGQAFRTDVGRGRTALAEQRPAEAVTALDRGLQRWRAEQPADVGTTTAALAWQRGWSSARLEAVEARVQARLATNHLDGLVAELEDVLGRHPGRDGLWEGLMAVQHAAGDRTAALETFHRARRYHAEELGLDPSPALRRAYETLLADGPRAGGKAPDTEAATADPAHDERRERLADRAPAPPVIFPVVGRDRERADVEDALADSRLVTLTGTGGVGKTTIAARLATDHDDVAWVELVARPIGAEVAGTVLAALGGSTGPTEAPRATASTLIGRAKLLVVLDNCEHVLGGVRDIVTTLLRHCPGVRILATSRQPLDIAGEHVVHVAPLDVTLDGPAMVLLAANVSRRGGRLDDVDADGLARLCARLDGLPLALELVAPLVPQLGVDAITSGLDDRFGLLDVAWDATGRERDLAGTVAWSETLLPADLRPLFREISVFAGPFDAASVTAVCASIPRGGAEPAAAGALAALARRGLVEPVADEPGRFRMLETVREHGRRALGARGRMRVGQSHARWMAALADEVATDFLSAEEQRLSTLVDHHRDEIMAAHRWACDHDDADLGLRIACGVAPVMMTGVRGDLAALVEATTTAFGTRPHPLAHEAWSQLAVWRAFSDDRDGAIIAMARAVVAAESVDAPLPLTWWRGDVELRLRGYDLAGALDALGRAERAGLSPVELAIVEAPIVPLEASMGRIEAAGRRSLRLQPLLDSTGSPTAIALSDAGIAITTGLAPDEAASLLAHAAERAHEAGSWLAESIVRMLQARVAGMAGDDAGAARGLVGLVGEWGRRGSWRYEWNTMREAMVVLARVGRHHDVLVLDAAADGSDAAPGLLGDQQQVLAAAVETAQRELGGQLARSAVHHGRLLDDAEAAEHTREALVAVASSTSKGR